MVGKVHLFYENLPESCEKKFSSLIAVKRFGYLTIALTGILGIARKNGASFFCVVRQFSEERNNSPHLLCNYRNFGRFRNFSVYSNCVLVFSDSSRTIKCGRNRKFSMLGGFVILRFPKKPPNNYNFSFFANFEEDSQMVLLPFWLVIFS